MATVNPLTRTRPPRADHGSGMRQRRSVRRVASEQERDAVRRVTLLMPGLAIVGRTIAPFDRF
jgi:hypothetical protein